MTAKFFVLGQFNNSVNLLKIDVNTGEAQIIPAAGVDDKVVSVGRFDAEQREQGTDVVALLATPNGPLLFLNSLQYYIDRWKTRIDIQDGARCSRFVVWHDERLIFDMTYEEKFGIASHPYNNNRDDIDFYYWLSQHILSSHLYFYYCKNVVYFE